MKVHVRPRVRPAVRARHLRPRRPRLGPGRDGAAVNSAGTGGGPVPRRRGGPGRPGLTDLYLRYVKAGLRPLLLAAGVVLIMAAVATVWYERRAGVKPATVTDTDTSTANPGSPGSSSSPSSP